MTWCYLSPGRPSPSGDRYDGKPLNDLVLDEYSTFMQQSNVLFDDTVMGNIVVGLEGDEKVREGLQGPVARALADAAVATWLEGRASASKRLRAMQDEVASTEACELLPWAVELVQMQVSALAMQQMQRMSGPAAGSMG